MNIDRRMSASTASALAYVLLVMGVRRARAAGRRPGDRQCCGRGLLRRLGGLPCRFGDGFPHSVSKAVKVGGFRRGDEPVSIFSAPLPQEQIDRYLENYRPQRRVTHSSNTRSNRDVVTVTPLQPKYRAVA